MAVQRMMTTCLFMKMERTEDVRREGKTAASTWGIVSPRNPSESRMGLFGGGYR
jgi:hypothetical protein